MTKTFNFSANAQDFGNWEAATQAAAQEAFASDAGYKSWAAMVEQAEEVGGGNSVEIREVLENGQLSSALDAE
jgi:ABC-type branched-subunit amino acid transport system substrate-binding protein